MTIPTEPIGSIPRPPELIQANASFQSGGISAEELNAIGTAALQDTILRLEQTGSPC